MAESDAIIILKSEDQKGQDTFQQSLLASDAEKNGNEMDAQMLSGTEEEKLETTKHQNKQSERIDVEYSLQGWPTQRGFTSESMSKYESGDYKKLWKEIPLILPHEAIRFCHQLIR
ncbi:hypothetical protein RFI_06149, partial [Reticulomyxa filosa]